jgi:RHS repeat-associated protein
MRTAKTVSAWFTTLTTTYVLDGVQVVEERPEPPPEQANRSPVWHFHGPGIDNLLAMKDRLGGVTYLTHDHLGSVREELSPEGILQRRRDYDPWGRLVAGGAAGWAFTGREWDGAFYYHRNRYLSPDLGRFVSEDPAGTIDGANVYAFVHNNPLRWLDPSGLAIWNCFFTTGADVGGLVTAKCKSEDCVGGQRVTATYVGGVFGFGGHIGPADLDDGMPAVNASNLEGLFGLATIGVDFVFAKFDMVTAAFMGKGQNVEFLQFGGGGEPEEKPRRPKVGALSVVGYVGKVAESRQPCCK